MCQAAPIVCTGTNIPVGVVCCRTLETGRRFAGGSRRGARCAGIRLSYSVRKKRPDAMLDRRTFFRTAVLLLLIPRHLFQCLSNNRRPFQLLVALVWRPYSFCNWLSISL